MPLDSKVTLRRTLKILLLSLICLWSLGRCQQPEEKPKELFDESEFANISQVDSGKAVGVMMTIYKTTLIADGRDQTQMRVAMIDSLGREIRSADDSIRIYVKGDALVTKTDGGALPVAIDTAGAEYQQYQLTNGLAFLTFHSDTQPGKISLEVRAKNVWPSSHEIHTIPATIIQKEPEPDQLTSTTKYIDKMIGADISFLPQMEARGSKFFDHGVEKDAITLLHDHGYNYIRLRIFVNPEHEKGYSPNIGYCGLDTTLVMAKRIKAAGMNLLLNFHYSDYWADPQQQNKPLNWQGLDFDLLKDSLKAYTVKVLKALNEQNTPPSMVQVGNEINHGILWPEGHIDKLDNLAELLKAGVEGVYEVDPDIPVMMHLALGGQNEEAVFWLNNMIARGVKFDIIGLSYYPRWHGTLYDLDKNLRDLIQRYHKPVNVVEYGTFRKTVNEVVFNLPDDMGKGTCIWEPLGRFGGMFDSEGNVKDVISVYDSLSAKYLRTPQN